MTGLGEAVGEADDIRTILSGTLGDLVIKRPHLFCPGNLTGRGQRPSKNETLPITPSTTETLNSKSKPLHLLMAS